MAQPLLFAPVVMIVAPRVVVAGAVAAAGIRIIHIVDAPSLATSDLFQVLIREIPNGLPVQAEPLRVRLVHDPLPSGDSATIDGTSDLGPADTNDQ